MSRTRLHVFGLAALALVMAWLYGSIDYLGAFADVDLKQYRAMAQAVPRWATETPQPFVFRILGPYLVGLLPVADPLGFRLLTIAVLVALTVALYTFQRRLGLVGSIAALTAALLTFNPYVFGFFAFNPFQLADVLAMLAIVTAFHLLLDRRWGLFALVTALGVLSREPALLVLPAAAVYVGRGENVRSEAGRLLLASVPAMVLFVLPRLLIEPTGGPSLWQTFLNASGKAASPETWYRLLINAWAPLSLLPLVLFETTRAFVRRHLFLMAFAALVLASAMFGGDQERLIAPAFVTVYALVGYLLQHDRWPLWTRGVLVAAAVLTSLHHLTARFPLPSRTWTIVLSLLALAVVTGVGVWVRSQRSERTTVDSTVR